MKIDNEYVQPMNEIRNVEGKIDKCPDDSATYKSQEVKK